MEQLGGKILIRMPAPLDIHQCVNWNEVQVMYRFSMRWARRQYLAGPFFPVDIIVYRVIPVFDFVMLDWINFQENQKVAYNPNPDRVEHYLSIKVVVKPTCLCKLNCDEQETQVQPAIDVFLAED